MNSHKFKYQTAPIFDLQRFSLHDGPGIRTLIFMKGCNLRCVWCHNPESQNPHPVVAFYSQNCKTCMNCKSVCQEGAILDGDYRIDQEKCTACGKCESACPWEALKMIGRLTSTKDLLESIRLDLPYFKRNHGGFTFSGGEPLLHRSFISEFLDLCDEDLDFKKIKPHRNIETAGFISIEKNLNLLKRFDLIYFDLKSMESDFHVNFTGKDNKQILDNARILVEEGLPIEFRMPLVDGFTDSESNLKKVVNFLRSVKIPKIHLLKYHNMGERKIEAISGKQPRLGLSNYNENKFEQVKSFLKSEGLQTIHY